MRLKLIAANGIKSALIFDMDAGASTLADTSFVDGHNQVAVLNLSVDTLNKGK